MEQEEEQRCRTVICSNDHLQDAYVQRSVSNKHILSQMFVNSEADDVTLQGNHPVIKMSIYTIL